MASYVFLSPDGGGSCRKTDEKKKDLQMDQKKEKEEKAKTERKPVNPIPVLIAVYGVLGLAATGVYAAQNLDSAALFSSAGEPEPEPVEESVASPEEEALWVRPQWSGKLTAGAEFFEGGGEEESISDNSVRPVHLLLAPEEEEEAVSANSLSTQKDDARRKEDTGPYYSFTVMDLPFDSLSIHDASQGGGATYGSVPAGTTGYVIEKGNSRTLVYVDGVYGYLSNLYIRTDEVPEEEYPSDLKGITSENVPLSGQKAQ